MCCTARRFGVATPLSAGFGVQTVPRQTLASTPLRSRGVLLREEYRTGTSPPDPSGGDRAGLNSRGLPQVDPGVSREVTRQAQPERTAGGWRPVPAPPTRQHRPTASGRRGVLLDQTVAQRVGRQIRIRLEVHLFEHTCAVGTDGLHADEQLRGDLRDAASDGELAQDLELALRQ